MSNLTTSTGQLNAGFERARNVLVRLLPEHLNVDRIIRLATSAYNRSPLLQRCTPISIIKATIVAAELGLEPSSALGDGYLVPFGTEATFIPGYRGLIRLARQSGEVLSISAYVVDEADHFEIELGLNPTIVHKPAIQGRANKMKAVYAVAKLSNGGHAFEFMTPYDVDLIKNRSRGASSGPWKTDYYEMSKKTVLKRMLKLLTLSSSSRHPLALAVAADNAADMGETFRTPLVEQLEDTEEGESQEETSLLAATIEQKMEK